MRYTWLFILTILPFAWLAGGCETGRSHMPSTHTPLQLQLNRLHRDEYTVIGDSEAKSCVTYVGLFPLPVWYVAGDDPEEKDKRPEFWLFGLSVTDHARERAHDKALAHFWQADSLLAPREHIDEYAAYPWYAHVCVTIRGKAIAITPDKP